MSSTGKVDLIDPILSDIEHVALNMRADDAREIYNYLPHDSPLALARTCMEYLARGHWGVCATLDGLPVACVGLLEQRPGVFEGWAFATDAFPLVALTLSKFIKREVFPIYRKAGAHRVWAASRFDHYRAHRWLELLGFHFEGVQVKAGKDKSDYLIFAVND